MRSRGTQYLNELVSLTVLALMVLALAAGQGAFGSDGARELATSENGVISIEVNFRHEGE